MEGPALPREIKKEKRALHLSVQSSFQTVDASLPAQIVQTRTGGLCGGGTAGSLHVQNTQKRELLRKFPFIYPGVDISQDRLPSVPTIFTSEGKTPQY